MTIECPNCGSLEINNSRIVYDITLEDNNYLIMRCNECRVLYTYHNSDIDVASLYDSGDYKIQDTRNTIFETIQNIEYSRTVRYLIKRKIRSIIDYGSGKGVFLALAQKSGMKVYGVEISKPRSDYAKSAFNLHIDTKRYESGNIFGGLVDAITLFHVVEHLEKPQNILSNLIKYNLNKDGIVIIEVPNFNSLQSRIAGSRWMHLDVSRHILHYDKNSLNKILTKLKLEPIKYEGFSIHLGVPGMVQSIMNLLFSYKHSLINDLKYNRSVSLLFMIILVLPIAVIAELCASMFLMGGIIRVYAKYVSK
jgi:2-polyprenyl-3-methyl-5-hydroxy-6-metoxy-1,4-benzoquinol methylase